MKELSIEEKATRYDEAIEIAKEINNEQRAQPFNIMTKVFPELADSEDEKIRKALIKLVKKTGQGYENIIDGVSIENAISWLEKQGEHANFRNKIQIGDKVTRNKDGVLVNLSQLNRVAKKQGEQKLELLTKEKALKNSPFVEQKSAEWSEDDQSNFCELRSFIVETYRAEDASKLITWLESLKERVQPQPKQEWSEEDEAKRKFIEDELSGLIADERDIESPLTKRAKDLYSAFYWLKSLKPQSTWKPSEEQLRELRCVISGCSFETPILIELEEQLKKL